MKGCKWGSKRNCKKLWATILCLRGGRIVWDAGARTSEFQFLPHRFRSDLHVVEVHCSANEHQIPHLCVAMLLWIAGIATSWLPDWQELYAQSGHPERQRGSMPTEWRFKKALRPWSTSSKDATRAHPLKPWSSRRTDERKHPSSRLSAPIFLRSGRRKFTHPRMGRKSVCCLRFLFPAEGWRWAHWLEKQQRITGSRPCSCEKVPDYQRFKLRATGFWKQPSNARKFLQQNCIFGRKKK